MKQIICFSEEYKNFCIAKVIPDSENAIEHFYNFVKERTMELFSVSEKEAEGIMEGNKEEDVTYNIAFGEGDAVIRLPGNEYKEYIKLTNVPDMECTKRKDNLEVRTSAGIIRAERSADPGQPGICVVLQPAGFKEEIDLSFVSVYEDEEYKTKDNERPVDVIIMTYGDVYDEDYTSKILLRKEDVISALTQGRRPGVYASSIKWDTDGEEVAGLPSELYISGHDIAREDENTEEITPEEMMDRAVDWLSDEYGFCISSIAEKYIS